MGGETARLPHKGNGGCYHGIHFNLGLCAFYVMCFLGLKTTSLGQYLSLVSTANCSKKKDFHFCVMSFALLKMSGCKFVQSLLTAVTANAATIIDHIRLAFILYTL